MEFTEVRNEITFRLEKHIGCPVVASEPLNSAEYPCCYYSVLTPRTSDHSFGLNDVQKEGDGYVVSRSERVAATMSFTFCSQDHDTEDGFVFGEDESLSLAEKAHGFFLLDAHNIGTERGDIVINNVGPVTKRTSYVVDDYVRRYGFDVKLYYIRTDTAPTTVIGKVKPTWLKNL